MSCANGLWGAPRIHGELLKLGIVIDGNTIVLDSLGATGLVSRRRALHKLHGGDTIRRKLTENTLFL
jgi:hypothetical protein